MQPAKFEKRDDVDTAALSRRQGPTTTAKEAAAMRKRQRLLEQRSLAEWDSGLASGKRSCTVVLTGLFAPVDAPDDEEEAAPFYANVQQDVEVECRKAGVVEKVTVFEGSERGAVAVRFKDPDDAERCVTMMDERAFGQTAIRCEIYDGVTDYRAKAKQQASADGGSGGSTIDGSNGGDDAASLEEQAKKLDEFGDWLEAGSTDEELDAHADD